MRHPDFPSLRDGSQENRGETMTFRTLIICAVMLATLVSCQKAKESFEKGFKESFQKKFITSCTESATKGGAPEAYAREKCTCIAAYLVSKYSSKELMKASNTELPESKKMFSEAVDSCK
jgi:hypothetical protein